MRNRILSVAAATTLILTLGACGGRDDSSKASGSCDQGITDSEVKLGMSVPMSGAGAAYGVLQDSSKAVFEQVNADGGVKMADGKKRKITLIAEDDAYDPAKTVSNTKKLVEQDKVFAMYSVLGTSPNLAIADYAKGKGLPVLFSQTGTDEFLKMHKDNNWIVGYLPQYGFEAKVMAKYVLDHKPNGKVAILYQNDGFGKGMVANFKKDFEGTGVTIVSEQGYEQSGGSIDSQIVNMQSSGADVFLDYATGTFMTQSLKKKGELGWSPLTLLTSGSSDASTLVAPAGPAGTTGALTFKWAKDPTDPAFAGDPDVKQWNEFASTHGLKPQNGIANSGWMTANLMVETLKETDGCKRKDLLDAVYNLKNVKVPGLLEGVTVNMKPDYPYILTRVQMQKFDGSHWTAEGGILKREDMK
ncbi:ABC transporter substrate-binding protein [Cumulibacter manganitolerans]|uniref:ABC transporter substrate-binding protein n=1 Tax=Cumulibacter manganitolerans TaxID=1884992 RepID=UPI001297528C|nr:ABC transporter substrate-binding protein [Cumulibacter manganitolerans]